MLDLPQVHQKPPSDLLLDTLASLARGPSQFQVIDPGNESTQNINTVDLSRYLTSIIASPLDWIQDEAQREEIWTVASYRISERSGRSALPSISRTFDIEEGLQIRLHEPSLTEDTLGHKTWTSSLLLARQLRSLRPFLSKGDLRVLELGAGTGLVGLAAACTWNAKVRLTDLPDIYPNLQRNVESNRNTTESFGGQAVAGVLDWASQSDPMPSQDQQYNVVVATDPIYSPEHPSLLAKVIKVWLLEAPESRLIIELPLRDGYDKERDELRSKLETIHLGIESEGEDLGYDDWEDSNGDPVEVRCWWSVWRYS